MRWDRAMEAIRPASDAVKSTRRWHRAAPGAFAVAAVVLVACTSGGDSSSPVTSASDTSPSAASTTAAPAPDASDATAASTTTAAESSAGGPPAWGVACEPTPSAEPRKVVLWSILVKHGDDELQKAVLRFNQLDPSVQVQVGFSGETSSEIEKKLRAGERPDLIIDGSNELINMVDGGLITPVQRCMDATPTFFTDDILPLPLATYRRSGQQVAMPVAASTPVLVYDKNTFRAAGLDPERPPQTMDELHTALRKIVDSGAATIGLTYGEATWFVSQWAAQCDLSLLPNVNGRDVNDAEVSVSLENPCLIDALEQLQRWSAEGLVAAPTTPNTEFDDLLSLVAPRDNAGMALHTSGSLSQVYDVVETSPEMNAEVGVGPLPGPGRGSTVGGDAMYITSADPEVAWAAWSFVQYMLRPEQQAGLASVGYAPVTVSALDEPTLREAWAKRPGLRAAYDQLAATSVSDAMLTVVSGDQGNLFRQLNWAAEDIIRGVPVGQSLLRAKIDIDTVLDMYRTMRYGAP